jgi:aquaporin Z
MDPSLAWRPAYLAELLGTFLLTLAVSVALTSGGPEVTPLVAALTLGVCVYTLGPVSGCHLNPGVTAGMWSIGRMRVNDAVAYVLAQCIGALLAMVAARGLVGVSPTPIALDLPVVGIAEALGTAILAFGVAAVALQRVSPGASGATVGGSLLLGILVASTSSNGVINPAVALGIGSLSFSYVLGPLVGGIVGAQLQKALKG